MLRALLLVAALAAASVSAFIPTTTLTPQPQQQQQRAAVVMRAEGSGGVSRQEQLGSTLRGLGLAGLGAAFLSAGAASPAAAKEKLEYLQEPTPEFKALQERAMEFEKAEFEKKKSFKTKVAALEAAKTEPELVKGLDDLTQFVLTQKGLPLGVKKQQLITDIRKLKRAGKDGKFWNKDAEISYEQLIYSINYQQSPNTARDLANPL